MKRRILAGLCLVFALPALAQAAAVRAPAEPVSALFYPNEVQVTVEERLVPDAMLGNKGFVLSLPVRARTDTFSVTINDDPADSYYFLNREEDILNLTGEAGTATAATLPPDRKATRPEQETNPKRKAILQSIVDIHVEIEKHGAVINAAQERIARWKDLPPVEKEVKPADLIALDKALGDVLPGLFETVSKGERLLQDAEQRLSEAEEALEEYDEGVSPSSRSMSPNARLVAVVPYEGTVGKTYVVRYTYILPGSFRPFYHIEAFPTKDSLSIEQNAYLTQESGFTWNNVDVSISTTGRDTALQPYPLAPWIVRLGIPVPAPLAAAAPRTKAAEAPLNMAQMSTETDEDMVGLAYAPAPQQQEMGTFRLWTIGKRSIGSGVPVSVSMHKETYPATFYYTLRPEQSNKGFLTADLNLDQALELPYGVARFFVDKSLVGDQALSLNGSKATLYFGTDPQVVVTRKDIKHTTGEQGFISKEQTVQWHWELSVRNTRSRVVEAWVEDARPDVQDESIKLVVESTPKAEEVDLKPQQGGTKSYRWKLTLQPNEVKTIEHKVQLLAPSDKQLNPGRYN